MILVKLNNGKNIDGGVTYIDATRGVMVRDVHIQADLQPGTYAVFTEMDWLDYSCYKGGEYVISRYGPGAFAFEDISSSCSKEQALEIILK